jgi:hypothetical protein
MVMANTEPVNGGIGAAACMLLRISRAGVSRKDAAEQSGPQKKAGLKKPGLRYWPREADTITFQEGLLSFRATGGGGQMRNANAQRESIMIRSCALQQPSTSHVSHAGSGAVANVQS